jgi:hypothetical protein
VYEVKSHSGFALPISPGHQFHNPARRIFSRSLTASFNVAFINGFTAGCQRSCVIERMRRWIRSHGCCVA